jgi:Raf kinase inhibitor-like YbhB/YbcL family protein
MCLGVSIACFVALACSIQHEEAMANETKVATLTVKSSAFTNEAPIPSRFTCDGDEVSPPLSWSAGPESTKCYALIVDDPDAPSGTFVHWVAWNIAGTELGEGIAKDASRADGMRQGKNSWSKTGYGGPCPPSGMHRYFFKVFALDRTLELPPSTDSRSLTAAMSGHVLAQGELMGKYARKR